MGLSLHPLSPQKGVVLMGSDDGGALEFFEKTGETRKETSDRMNQGAALGAARRGARTRFIFTQRVIQDIITMKSLILAQDER